MVKVLRTESEVEMVGLSSIYSRGFHLPLACNLKSYGSNSMVIK